MTPVGIAGAWIHQPRLFEDARGSFHAWFQGTQFRAAVGHDLQLRQANCVVSRKGVLRGIHFTEVPAGQAKYLTCVRGAVLAAVVDIRQGSPTFAAWRTVELTAGECPALYVAEGLGLGFLAVSEDSMVVYLCSESYDPQREHGLHPLDPELGIRWPADIVPELSERDANAPSLAEAGRRGLLPRFSDCLPYLAAGAPAEQAT